MSNNNSDELLILLIRAVNANTKATLYYNPGGILRTIECKNLWKEVENIENLTCRIVKA